MKRATAINPCSFRELRRLSRMQLDDAAFSPRQRRVDHRTQIAAPKDRFWRLSAYAFAGANEERDDPSPELIHTFSDRGAGDWRRLLFDIPRKVAASAVSACPRRR